MYKMKERRFCPKCKSENVKLDVGNMPGAPGNWVCNECGFHNSEFPVKEKILNKKTNSDKNENKTNGKKLNMNKMALKIILIIGIIAVVAVILMLIGNRMEANAIREKHEIELYQDWLSENCECLERSRPVCTMEGFEYNATRELCVNSAEKTVTYALLKCSKYDCSGQNVTWNNKTWEPRIN